MFHVEPKPNLGHLISGQNVVMINVNPSTFWSEKMETSPAIPKIIRFQKRKPRRSIRIEALEAEEAKTLIEWVNVKGFKKYPELRLLYHIPNGEKRERHIGKKLKAMGLVPGIPDYCLPVARKGANALYIELKRKNSGSPSEEQLAIGYKLSQENNAVYIAAGWERAVEILEWYLSREERRVA